MNNYLQFNGKICYHNTIETTHDILNRLLVTINRSNALDNKIVVGFDCEWKAFPRPSKVCLIQLYIDSEECHLFHISAMNYRIPLLLHQLLIHKNCLKVGLNISGDIWKLQRDYGMSLDQTMFGDTKSVIDLSDLANNLLGMNTRWSLSRLSEFVINKTICKDKRLSDWSRNPLTSEQKTYAAIDAFASYELYFEIKLKSNPHKMPSNHKTINDCIF